MVYSGKNLPLLSRSNRLAVLPHTSCGTTALRYYRNYNCGTTAFPDRNRKQPKRNAIFAKPNCHSTQLAMVHHNRIKDLLTWSLNLPLDEPIGNSSKNANWRKFLEERRGFCKESSMIKRTPKSHSRSKRKNNCSV